MDKEDNHKEKFKKALISTIRVISDEYNIEKNVKKNLSSNNFNFFELDNLNNKQDYIKSRAEADSEALKIKFSNVKIYKKNLPKNSSCKVLYDIAEKIRYETLGKNMLKGISRNLHDNYEYQTAIKRKDQLKTRDDVKISEAFELYILQNLFGLKLNPFSKKILSFWEKDFKFSIDKHLEYFAKNLENQEAYSSRFSKILQEMDVFEAENDDEKNDNQEDENNDDNNLNQNEDSDSQGKQEKKQEEESQSGLDTDYDFSDYKIDEQLVDTDSEKQSSETILQKNKLKFNDKDYKIFTTEFDEIAKAENLENIEEITKLRKNLDQQLISFQDLITKLANKLQRQLLAKQNRSWEFDLEEGLLDSSKLSRIIMDPYNSLSFKKEKDLDFKDTVVTLLIDNSGSMRGVWPPNL